MEASGSVVVVASNSFSPSFFSCYSASFLPLFSRFLFLIHPFFFLNKGRSTTASYKKKNHSYITRRSEHHHHADNARKQHTTKHYTTTTWESSQKKPPANYAVINAVPRQKSQPAAGLSGSSNSSTMGLSPSSRHRRSSIPLLQ